MDGLSEIAEMFSCYKDAVRTGNKDIVHLMKLSGVMDRMAVRCDDPAGGKQKMLE